MRGRKPEREAKRDRETLIRCGIEPAAIPDPGAWNRWEGKLNGFTFRRQYHRSYWIARGRMPVAVAWGLYKHPVGRTDIRVAGHCGSLPPEYPWVRWWLDGERIVHDPDGKQERAWDDFEVKCPGVLQGCKPRFEQAPASLGAKAFIDLYHVDTELGLYVLAEAVRGL